MSSDYINTDPLAAFDHTILCIEPMIVIFAYQLN